MTAPYPSQNLEKVCLFVLHLALKLFGMCGPAIIALGSLVHTSSLVWLISEEKIPSRESKCVQIAHLIMLSTCYQLVNYFL